MLTIRIFKTMKSMLTGPNGGMALQFEDMLSIYPDTCQRVLNDMLVTCVQLMAQEQYTIQRYCQISTNELFKGIFDEPFEEC